MGGGPEVRRGCTMRVTDEGGQRTRRPLQERRYFPSCSMRVTIASQLRSRSGITAYPLRIGRSTLSALCQLSSYIRASDTMRGQKRVLIVEDTTTGAQLMMKAFQAAPALEAKLATDGKEALDMMDIGGRGN